MNSTADSDLVAIYENHLLICARARAVMYENVNINGKRYSAMSSAPEPNDPMEVDAPMEGNASANAGTLVSSTSSILVAFRLFMSTSMRQEQNSQITMENSVDQKFFHYIEEKTSEALQNGGYGYYSSAKLHFLQSTFSELKACFDDFCSIKTENCNSEFRQLYRLAQKCFGGKLLVSTIEKLEHIVLRHWGKKDHNNYPFQEFIPLPTSEQLDYYVDKILEDMDYEDDPGTKDLLKGYLQRPEDQWMEIIPDEDRELMETIRDESNHIDASQQIKKLISQAGEATQILIRFRTLQLEDFIFDSLPNFVGYVSQKKNDPSQKYRLSLVFLVTSTVDGGTPGLLVLPLLPKILKVRDPSKNRKKVNAWMFGTAYIKPITYLKSMVHIPVAVLQETNDGAASGVLP